MNNLLSDLVCIAVGLDDYYGDSQIHEFVQFKQVVKTASPGFNKTGGDAVTPTVITIVLNDSGNYNVWFGRHLAYIIPRNKISREFIRDISRRSMKPRDQHKIYIKD